MPRLRRLGIALLPTFFIHEALSSEALRSIDIGLKFEGAAICMAYSKGRRVSAKVVALAAWLRQCFGSPPYWDPDRGGDPSKMARNSEASP